MGSEPVRRRPQPAGRRGPVRPAVRRGGRRRGRAGGRRAAQTRGGELMELRVGDLVEVRSQEEILATLDERGELENLPFMPEMLRYCGQRLTVHKVAHKLCDTISRSGMRRMERAVHLTGARCDGSAHGGCQTACSLYWKEAWLRKVEPDEPPAPDRPAPRL